MLHCYHNNIGENLPIIDDSFVLNVSKCFCTKDNRGRPPSAQNLERFEPLQNFFEDHYQATMPVFEADMPQTHLGTILSYCATQ